MAELKTVALFGIVSLSFYCFALWKNSNVGVRRVLLLAGRGLLVLALATWLVSAVFPRLRSLFQSTLHLVCPQVPEDEANWERDKARKEQQEKHNEKASTYQEVVLRPRQESRLRKKQEKLYRMTGELWKLSAGQALRASAASDQDAGAGKEPASDTPNREAMRRQRLPETLVRVPPPSEPPQQKRVVVLPEEPPEDSEGAVRVALRCTSGRTFRRTFLKSHSSQVLLDWMVKIGYHPAIYTICTMYPRRPLNIALDISLEQAGITKNTVLNVDEKDPSPT
ncbi:UBX domain-containing protein 8 isoform X2 [Lepisosteus oculatus]|uniref:UBX domain protein 8 n=1 Tax=Lepisosteus oculatus TaxID=7918 RepID=W5MXT4_LEPOC|nr:PREDICTED: UBX domain-containing protein 8 isoform X2 [Lepisosteus oculatus]